MRVRKTDGIEERMCQFVWFGGLINLYVGGNQKRFICIFVVLISNFYTLIMKDDHISR